MTLTSSSFLLDKFSSPKLPRIFPSREVDLVINSIKSRLSLLINEVKISAIKKTNEIVIKANILTPNDPR